jgi:DNA recombination protein RmuC
MNALLLAALAALVLLAVLVIVALTLMLRLAESAAETSRKLAAAEAGLNARLDAVNTALKNLQDGSLHQTKSVGDQLAQNRAELDKRLAENQKLLTTLSEKIGQIDQANKSLADSIRQIDEVRRLLARPGGRGPLGEAILLETLTDVLPARYVKKPHSFSNGERVDLALVVRERIIPIDSKFPLEAYRNLQNAATEDERKRGRSAFASAVKKHIDAAAKYVREDEGTYPFALMYIPSEAVFVELAADEELAKQARSKHVVPVSPSSLLAYLEVILEGLKGFEVEKRTQWVLAQIREVDKLVAAIRENHGKVTHHVSNAANAAKNVAETINDLAQTLERIQKTEDEEPEGQPG